MAALKPLLDAECGTTNPLIKLSQFYTRDNTLVTQVNLLFFICIISSFDFYLGWSD
jgi:hypothetical protein